MTTKTPAPVSDERLDKLIGDLQCLLKYGSGDWKPLVCGAIGAIQRLRAGGWRPIESAPKTSRAILVWCPGNLCQYMVTWDGYEPNSGWRIWGGFGAKLTEMPTLWQPVPHSPAPEPDTCDHDRDPATCGECHGAFGVGA